MKNRKVILYISMSLDGFLATKEDDLSWLSMVNREGEDYGYYALQERVDTYLVGRHTYDVVLKLTGGKFFSITSGYYYRPGRNYTFTFHRFITCNIDNFRRSG